MEKKSFKLRRSVKENDLIYKEQLEDLNEKYTKMKGILKDVLKELNFVKESQEKLLKENEKLKEEIKTKDALLEKIQSVSEAVVEEYGLLKIKCGLKTEAAAEANTRATMYFQENQLLKRSTLQEEPSLQVNNSDEDICKENRCEKSEIIKDIATDVITETAELKVTIPKEIEMQKSLNEDFEITKKLYEQEMKEQETKEKLQSIESGGNSAFELCDTKQATENYASQYYVQDADKKINLKQETIDTSICEKIHTNSEKSRHDIRKEMPNFDMANQEPDPIQEIKQDLDIFSTSLKQDGDKDLTVDQPMQLSLQSDEYMSSENKMQEQLKSFKTENNILRSKVQELEKHIKKLTAEVTAADFLPMSAPPPPPPPPPPFNPIKSLITFINSGKKLSKQKKESVENPHQKVMSEMVDAIKLGKVHLKPTPKSAGSLSSGSDDTEIAYGELKTILSTMKKKRSLCEEEKVLNQEILCVEAHSSESKISNGSECSQYINDGPISSLIIQLDSTVQDTKLIIKEAKDVDIDEFGVCDIHPELPQNESSSTSKEFYEKTEIIYELDEQVQESEVTYNIVSTQL